MQKQKKKMFEDNEKWVKEGQLRKIYLETQLEIAES